ncbi:hypothetical protein [Pseudomonas sp. PAMC 26793]|uniref:hypothetical protein n=1 Tax=Pseudomonas sp. PAMC 26793 TaxID=1240676 RepID=UPI0003131172|nr:hypothetical protein [Pseudomonas sp. PAMC 26793]
MTSSVLKDGFPAAHRTTRERIEGSIDLGRLFAAIDADPAIAGAGVVYLDDQLWPVTLREFQPICSVLPKRLVLREAPRYMARLDFIRELQQEPRESQVVLEAVGMGASCSGAILGWFVATSGTVAIPFTAGVSTVVAGIGAAAATASSFQCGVAAIRTYNEISDPAANDEMSERDWYHYVMPVLDGVSLLGAGTSGLTTLRLLQARKVSTGRSWSELSRGLTRQQRKALTNELLRLRDPHMSIALRKFRQRTAALPKSYSPTQINHATITQIQDAVGATMSVIGSGVSGNIRTLAIGLYEEFE